MAVNNLFGKAKNIAGNTAATVALNSQLKVISKSITERMSEKSKLYGYIGMEAYDLYTEGKLDMPELQGYFEKLQTLNDEIRKLQADKQAMELRFGNGTTCICGESLTQTDKFCPRCGTPVNNGMITCTCGNQVANNMRFCNACGRDLQQNPVMMQPHNPNELSQVANHTAANVPQEIMKQCICGAYIPEGTFMCMECGRKIE